MLWRMKRDLFREWLGSWVVLAGLSIMPTMKAEKLARTSAKVWRERLKNEALNYDFSKN
jgi:hypothetical protein